MTRASSATLDPKPWLWSGRRVLIEHRDESAGMEHARALRDAGYSVAVCPGPDSRERCPLTGPPGCALAHGADVVVSSLGLERPEAREVLKELRLQCPGVPLIVEAAGGDEDEWQDLLRGCEVIAAPARPDRLVAAVDAAFAARRREP